MTLSRRSLATASLALLALFPARPARAQVAPAPELPTPRYGGEPAATPFSQPPRLLNIEQVRLALKRYYPMSLQRAGVAGEPLVWLLIDQNGDLASLRLARSSGHVELDAAALHLAGEMRFAPARQGEQPLQAWVRIPVKFAPVEGAARGALAAVSNASTARAPRGAALDFAAHDPETEARMEGRLDQVAAVNAVHVLRQLAADYAARFPASPPKGDVTLDLRIDADGNVAGAQVRSPAHVAALDSLALGLAPRLVFVPSLQEGRYVEARTSLKVKFPPELPK